LGWDGIFVYTLSTADVHFRRKFFDHPKSIDQNVQGLSIWPNKNGVLNSPEVGFGVSGWAGPQAEQKE